jgi:hypothetical protein
LSLRGFLLLWIDWTHFNISLNIERRFWFWLYSEVYFTMTRQPFLHRRSQTVWSTHQSTSSFHLPTLYKDC